MSPLECLAVLCLRRVYGGSCKTCCFRRCHVSKLEDVSHEMLVLRLPRLLLSLWLFSVFAVSKFVSRKLQNIISFSTVSGFRIGGCLAGNARLEAPTCLLLSVWLSFASAVSMGEAAKLVVFASVTFQNWRMSRTKCSF